MAVVTIRSLPDEVHHDLKQRAHRDGRSTAADVRAILEDAGQPTGGIGSALRALGHSFGGVELNLRRDRNRLPADCARVGSLPTAISTMKPRRTVNPKRKLRPAASAAPAMEQLRTLSKAVSYGGNPEHKRNPGDFGLSPPAVPRQGKSLCDTALIFSRAEALRLLRRGIERGLVSVQERNGWPQNVWAVTDSGIALEAVLENPETGTYHAYPMLPIDPLIDEVVARWKAQ